MTLRQWLRPIVGSVVLAALTACGNSDENEQASIIDGSGAPVPDLAVSGRVTGFGSVYIDGVPYATDDAEVFVNGEQATEAALAVGDYVTLFAQSDTDTDVDTAAAQKVYLETAVAGEVTAIDEIANTFTVLGQTIKVDYQTSFAQGFADNAPTALAVGDFVDVRGVIIADAKIYATRIVAAASGDTRLSGRVQALNDNDLTFKLNGVAVAYHALTLDEALAEGDWVSVAGNWQGDALVLTSLRQREDQRLPVGITLTLNGKASDVVNNQFTLAGRTIELNAQTEFTSGTAQELSDGREVTLTGDVQSDGTVRATSVAIKPFYIHDYYQDRVIEFISDGTDMSPGAFPKGLGITGYFFCTVDDRTEIVYSDDPEQMPLTFEDLRKGDIIAVEFEALDLSRSNYFEFAKALRIEVDR